jgi:hypothetical protein
MTQEKKHKLTPAMEARKWQPGRSGNPGGKPANGPIATKAFRELASATHILVHYLTPGKKRYKNLEFIGQPTQMHTIGIALLAEAQKGNVMAAREFIDRTDGKAAQTIQGIQPGSCAVLILGGDDGDDRADN